MRENPAEFLKSLRDEKLKHKEHRMSLVLQKLSYTVGLFGLGSISVPNFQLETILYLIPYVALGYDMYIFAEDYKVKRIGEFLKQECQKTASVVELDWEKWVHLHREPLAARASFILSILVVFASSIAIFLKISNHTVWYFWFPVTLVASGGVFLYAQQLKQNLRNMAV